MGFMEKGDTSLLGPGLTGLGLLVVYGIVGGFIGGVILAVLYNRILGERHGIRMLLEP